MNHLIDNYLKRLNLPNASYSLIEHEDAMVSIVYKIIQKDGKPLILKICDRKNDYLREVHFLKFFASQLPVPRIIDVIPPDETLHGAILMECLPGELLQPNEITDSLASELGRCLALIHQHRMSGYGDVVQNNLFKDPRDYLMLKFEEGIQECLHHLPADIIEKCRQYLETHLDLLSTVDGPCVVHRDYRPGNLIVSDGKLQGIIDWAGARASFAEEDFCSLEHGEWSENHECKNSFLSGYANVRPLPDYKRVLLLLRLNKALGTIGFTVKRGTWKSTHKDFYQYNRSFLEKLLQ